MSGGAAVAGLTLARPRGLSARAWTEWIADLSDHVPGGVPGMIIFSILAAVVAGLLWYFYPAWLPSRWSWGVGRRQGERRKTRRVGRGRFGRLRWRLRWRRRGRKTDAEPEPLPDDQVPDLPAEVLALSADQLAAAGRYAEAVRERLRSMLRLLMERGVLPASPGWTVMELVAAGRRTRPALAGPLSAGAEVFSQIWYGLRPATADDDVAMRTYASQVSQVAEQPEPQPAGAA
jgi:hypothetical protein